MFGKLNEQAASALLSLEPGDLSYCLKLAKRFEHMGIESDQASNALCTLVESGVSWRRSTRRGKRMQSNVEAVFEFRASPRMICSVSSASCGATARSLVFPCKSPC